MKGRNARKRARHVQETEWAYRHAILSAECPFWRDGGLHHPVPGSAVPGELHELVAMDDLGAEQHAWCVYCDSPITCMVTNDGVTVWFRTPKLILEEP